MSICDCAGGVEMFRYKVTNDDYNKVNYKDMGLHLYGDVETIPRVKLGDWDCTCPDNWVTCMATNNRGCIARVWWYIPGLQYATTYHVIVSGTYCHDVVILEGDYNDLE